MGNFLIVCPPDAGKWSISREEFAKRVLSRWPEGKVEYVKRPESNLCLEFLIPMTHSTVEGGLDKSGESLLIDYGDYRDSVELVLWYRSVVPSSQPLVFCDSGGGGYTDLTTDTTAAELLSDSGDIPPEDSEPKE